MGLSFPVLFPVLLRPLILKKLLGFRHCSLKRFAHPYVSGTTDDAVAKVGEVRCRFVQLIYVAAAHLGLHLGAYRLVIV